VRLDWLVQLALPAHEGAVVPVVQPVPVGHEGLLGKREPRGPGVRLDRKDQPEPRVPQAPGAWKVLPGRQELKGQLDQLEALDPLAQRGFVGQRAQQDPRARLVHRVGLVPPGRQDRGVPRGPQDPAAPPGRLARQVCRDQSDQLGLQALRVQLALRVPLVSQAQLARLVQLALRVQLVQLALRVQRLRRKLT
jgi:hypothetical protein